MTSPLLNELSRTSSIHQAPHQRTLQRHEQNNISLEVLRDNSQNSTKLQLQSMYENNVFSDILWSEVAGNSFKLNTFKNTFVNSMLRSNVLQNFNWGDILFPFIIKFSGIIRINTILKIKRAMKKIRVTWTNLIMVGLTSVAVAAFPFLEENTRTENNLEFTDL